jgi:hypothetical protein
MFESEDSGVVDERWLSALSAIRKNKMRRKARIDLDCHHGKTGSTIGCETRLQLARTHISLAVDRTFDRGANAFSCFFRLQSAPG